MNGDAITALIGRMLVLLAGLMIDRAPLLLPYFLPVAAASFLYVAMSDLIPSLHRGPFERGARARCIG